MIFPDAVSEVIDPKSGHGGWFKFHRPFAGPASLAAVVEARLNLKPAVLATARARSRYPPAEAMLLSTQPSSTSRTQMTVVSTFVRNQLLRECLHGNGNGFLLFERGYGLNLQTGQKEQETVPHRLDLWFTDCHRDCMCSEFLYPNGEWPMPADWEQDGNHIDCCIHRSGIDVLPGAWTDKIDVRLVLRRLA